MIDQAMGCLMLGPRSYTGEDTFEIHCHGSPLVLETVLQVCLQEGCRAARPGEFTLRAFLNGRLDLAQAEAVVDVVRAQTNASLELAVRQLAGWLGERIEPLRQDVMGSLARMEAMVDFVEEDVPAQIDEATLDQLREAETRIEALLAGAEHGIVLREGASLCIAGAPNVGKSSIMNGLLGLERSIVTPVAGTTRDTVEETVSIGGVPFRAVDTAGMTETPDLVERMGIERSRQSLAAADVTLLVLDGSRPFGNDDALALETIEEAARDRDRLRLVVAINKSDLPGVLDRSTIAGRLPDTPIVESSAITEGGLDTLRTALAQVALGSPRQEYVVGNVRHQEALRRAAAALVQARNAYESGVPLDLVSFDVRAAANALGEITGACVDDELLDRIFRDFCIGK